MKTFGKIIVSLFVVCLMFAMVGCSTDRPFSSDPGEAETGSDVEELILVDDDIIKVTFVEIFEEPSIKGVCYLRMFVENKSGQSITVYLTDAYVNNTSVTIGSGVPMTIAPDKDSQNPFIIFNCEKSDIETLEFKVQVYDDGMNSIEESDTVTVEIARGLWKTQTGLKTEKEGVAE